MDAWRWSRTAESHRGERVCIATQLKRHIPTIQEGSEEHRNVVEHPCTDPPCAKSVKLFGESAWYIHDTKIIALSSPNYRVNVYTILATDAGSEDAVMSGFDPVRAKN